VFVIFIVGLGCVGFGLEESKIVTSMVELFTARRYRTKKAIINSRNRSASNHQAIDPDPRFLVMESFTVIVTSKVVLMFGIRRNVLSLVLTVTLLFHSKSGIIVLQLIVRYKN
jgi:hypothetical protein